MILTQIRNRVEKWFNRLVHQAIIDGLEIYNLKAKGITTNNPDDEKRKERLFVAGMVMWFVLVGVATYVAVFGGAK